MVQVPSYEEYQALAKRVEQIEEDNEFLKSLLLAERWLTRKQAMSALGCRDDKLRALTLNKTLTHRYEGKNPMYDVFSIRAYLTGQKIDSKEVDRRVLLAHFDKSWGT